MCAIILPLIIFLLFSLSFFPSLPRSNVMAVAALVP